MDSQSLEFITCEPHYINEAVFVTFWSIIYCHISWRVQLAHLFLQKDRKGHIEYYISLFVCCVSINYLFFGTPTNTFNRSPTQNKHALLAGSRDAKKFLSFKD